MGTFSIEQTTVSVGVDQFGVATLYMDNTWDPRADSAILHLGWDPAVIQYVSTDWRVGNSVSATLNAPGDLTLSFADWTNKYPSGRVPIADINFRGVVAGQTTLGIRIDSVRSHVGVSPTEFTELTASSLSNPGIFTVGQGGGGAVTTVPTIPGEPTGTIAPTLTVTPGATGTVIPTVTPIGTVTGNVTGGVTTPITIMTTVPTTAPTGITTGVPFVPAQGSTGGSEEYTGVVTRTATATPTTTTTATGTATPTSTATMGGAGTPGATPTGGQTIMDLARANPNLSTLVTAIDEAGLNETLAGAGPYTVFAPTNEAFDALPPGTLDALLQNREQLTSVLTYHVAAGRFTSDNLTATRVVRTVQGENVNVTTEAGRVRVDGAMVTQADIQGSNGVIHVIDAVMIPPAGAATPTATGTVMTTAPVGTTTARTTAPVNTTATATGVDALPLAVAGLAALALIAARRR